MLFSVYFNLQHLTCKEKKAPGGSLWTNASKFTIKTLPGWRIASILQKTHTHTNKNRIFYSKKTRWKLNRYYRKRTRLDACVHVYMYECVKKLSIDCSRMKRQKTDDSKSSMNILQRYIFRSHRKDRMLGAFFCSSLFPVGVLLSTASTLPFPLIESFCFSFPFSAKNFWIRYGNLCGHNSDGRTIQWIGL